MNYKPSLITAPTLEPITTTEAKTHMRLASTTLSGELTPTQCIPHEDHVAVASYGLEGTGVDVLGLRVLVLLESGTNGDTGTVDVKIQESDDDSTYTDWSGGSFTQVTTSNDNAVQEKEYTGTKQYIRTVATVANATCDFGTTVITSTPESSEDDYIDTLITAGRKHIESALLGGVALLQQTWDIYYDDFPDTDYIELPFPPLSSITSIKYTDTDATENTFSSDYYHTEAVSNRHKGRAVLKYGYTWPTASLRTYSPVVVRIVCGYGDEASDVPPQIRLALKILVAELYNNREETVIGVSAQKLHMLEALLSDFRVWSF